MKTTIQSIIVTIAIATLTACGTTGKRKLPPTATPVPTAPSATTQVRQVKSEPVEFVEFTKDAAGNIVTNRLTRHLITNLPRKRKPSDASQVTAQDEVSDTMHREFDLLWTALELDKNVDVLKTKYNASDDEIKALKKRFAPVLSGTTNGAPTSTAAPALGLGVISHSTADTAEAELRRQVEELRFQQWKAEQYRKKGFK